MTRHRTRRSPPHIADLTDVDLVSASSGSQSGLLPGIGCYSIFVGWLAVAALSGEWRGWGAVASTIGGSFCSAAFAGLLFAGCWHLTASALRKRAAAPYRREFLRRHGVHPAPSNNVVETPRGSVVMLRGRGLPSGGVRDVWAAVCPPPAVATEIVYATTPYADRSNAGELATGGGTASARSSTRIVECIDELGHAAVRPKLDDVQDGFPFTLELHRGATRGPDRFSGNLAAANWSDDPVCVLADAVLAAADSLGASRTLFGACSADGTVTIDER